MCVQTYVKTDMIRPCRGSEHMVARALLASLHWELLSLGGRPSVSSRGVKDLKVGSHLLEVVHPGAGSGPGPRAAVCECEAPMFDFCGVHCASRSLLLNPCSLMPGALVSNLGLSQNRLLICTSLGPLPRF